jgi:hypothetical protein
LRISAEALYVRAGILDARTGGPVVDAIYADPALSERQKQILLDVYASFKRENLATQSTVEGSDVDGEDLVDGPRNHGSDSDAQQ